MLKSLTLLSLAATLSLANAQAPVSGSDASPQPASEQMQAPAPIVRQYPQHRPWRERLPERAAARIVETQPTPGVWLRSESTGLVTTVSATAQRTEIRLERGRLNVTVHQPAQHSEILVDLPGGGGSGAVRAGLQQVSLLKDGLYTFNAETGTVRVLHGEAAFVGAAAGAGEMKPIKIKEDHELSLVGEGGGKPGQLKAVEAYPYELAGDLLPPANDGEPGGYAGNGYFEGGYAGLYGDYPAYPAYPWEAGLWGFYPGYYPGYYGYPFGYGIGIGYYRGFGYRGGFRR
jgi:hypothetical protein